LKEIPQLDNAPAHVV